MKFFTYKALYLFLFTQNVFYIEIKCMEEFKKIEFFEEEKEIISFRKPDNLYNFKSNICSCCNNSFVVNYHAAESGDTVFPWKSVVDKGNIVMLPEGTYAHDFYPDNTRFTYATGPFRPCILLMLRTRTYSFIGHLPEAKNLSNIAHIVSTTQRSNFINNPPDHQILTKEFKKTACVTLFSTCRKINEESIIVADRSQRVMSPYLDKNNLKDRMLRVAYELHEQLQIPINQFNLQIKESGIPLDQAEPSSFVLIDPKGSLYNISTPIFKVRDSYIIRFNDEEIRLLDDFTSSATIDSINLLSFAKKESDSLKELISRGQKNDSSDRYTIRSFPNDIEKELSKLTTLQRQYIKMSLNIEYQNLINANKPKHVNSSNHNLKKSNCWTSPVKLRTSFNR